MKKIILLLYTLPFFLFSCVSQKPAIVSIPEIDSLATVFYCSNKFNFLLNGSLLYQLKSFGKTDASRQEGENITGSNSIKDYILNYPLGKSDYSYRFSPSLSCTGRFLAKDNNDFKLIQLRLNRNVDVKIADLTDGNNIYDYTITLPALEYEDEKYQIPWSEKDEAFFAVKEDSLFKYYPGQNSKFLFTKDNIGDFKISPSERYSITFADDSVFLYDSQKSSFKFIYDVGRVLGINSKFVRAMSWLEDETKFTFAEGWHIYMYNMLNDSLSEFNAGQEVFYIEWIDNNQLLCVTGEYPSDLSRMQSYKCFKILIFDLTENNYKVIHERMNHEPFSIKPGLSPSKKLFLFSEKQNGTYVVKLMTFDGQNENILSEGILPFWGYKSK